MDATPTSGQPAFYTVNEAVWFEEGGFETPAWNVLVPVDGLVRTYWFRTESGARRFVAEHAAADR